MKERLLFQRISKNEFPHKHGMFAMTDIDLRSRWRVDNVELGRMLYESIPSHHRPRWATEILQLCYYQIKEDIQEVNDILNIGSNQLRWREAYEAFQSLRSLYLKKYREYNHTEPHDNHEPRLTSGNQDAQKRWQQGLILLLLFIAEIAAKIIYNVSEVHTSETMPAPFDYHAGWRMATEVRNFVEMLHSPVFEDEVWKKLIACT